MLLCRRIATSGVTCMKIGFGLVIAGTSRGSGSICKVIVPIGVGEGEAASSLLSSLSSLSDDALGCGVGLGLAVGLALLDAFGEPPGDGDAPGMLKARLHSYCWLNCWTAGHFIPVGPCAIGNCASLGASVAPGFVSSS